jgi:hypothetical protein
MVSMVKHHSQRLNVAFTLKILNPTLCSYKNVLCIGGKISLFDPPTMLQTVMNLVLLKIKTIHTKIFRISLDKFDTQVIQSLIGLLYQIIHEYILLYHDCANSQIHREWLISDLLDVILSVSKASYSMGL